MFLARGSMRLRYKEFSIVSGLLERFSGHTRRIFARHRGRAFLDGAMAAAALVTLADGGASIEEGAEVGRLMRVLDILRDYNPKLVVEAYLRHIDDLRNQPDGLTHVRNNVVAAANGDPEAAALFIVICHAISEADGIIRQSKLDEIQTLSNLLDVDAKTAVDTIAPISTTK